MMSKNLNKIVAFAIGVSVFTGSVVPAMAADTKAVTSVTSSSTTNKSKIYKVEDAVQDAVANSDRLAILNSSLSVLDAQKDVYEEYDDMGQDMDDKIDKVDIQISQAKQKRDFMQDNIKYNVTNDYNAIVLANEKIALAEENLKIKTDSYNQSKLKQQLGLSTSVSLKSEELELTKLKDDLEAQKKSVNDSIYKLGLTTGKDLSKAVFSNAIEYNKFTVDGSFEAYMEKSIKDIVRYDLDLIEISKDDLSDRKDDDEHKFPKQSDYLPDAKPEKPQKPQSGASGDQAADYADALESYKENLDKYNQSLTKYQNALTTYITYYSDKLANDQSVHTLNITEDAYRNAMKTNYTKLQGLEDSIKQAQTGLEILNENVRNTKLQYDLGLVTKNQYDQIVYKQKETQVSLETAIDGYNQLKGMLEQPWMMAVANG
ncbi:MAG: TolC family protein [Clostridium sp.]|nr:TolC family protein [Clostridium sp.]